MVFVGERSIPSDCGSDNVCSPQVRILSITQNREPTLCKLFVVKFKLWSCSQPSLREDMVTEKCKEYIYNLNCEYED